MDNLIIGNGEIGKSISEIVKPHHNVIIKDIDALEINHSIDYMHVCIRYSKDFVGIIKKYEEQYSPKFIIIHSTIAVGTMNKFENLKYYHAPVMGRHSKLPYIIQNTPMFLSGAENNQEVCSYLKGCGIEVNYVGTKYETTELAKLLCLLRYGIDIDLAKRQDELCKKYNVDYNKAVVDFEIIRNAACQLGGYGQMIRPVMQPPQDKIGGHCVLPALEMLENESILKETIQSILSWNGK